MGKARESKKGSQMYYGSVQKGDDCQQTRKDNSEDLIAFKFRWWGKDLIGRLIGKKKWVGREKHELEYFGALHVATSIYTG